MTQCIEKNTARDTHKLDIIVRQTYQKMTSKLENCTHFLDRAKRELLGYGKRGSSKGHSLAGGAEVRLGQDMERKLVRGTHLLEKMEVSYDIENK